VDYSVVFPFSGDLYFDMPTLIKEGRMLPATKPISNVPYERENRMLLTEIFHFCPEYKSQFIPFVCVDPVRDVAGQIKILHELEQKFPVYGIKVSPVGCQSKITGLLEEGEPLLEFAKKRNLPLLLHVTVHPEEEFSQASDAFKIIEKHSELRFCLAHCIGFHQEFLKYADSMANVWVDTAALKIQVQLAYENSRIVASPSERIDCDYSDHTKVMQALIEQFPKTIIWGTDSPAYSYICRRLQASGRYAQFQLKANYEDEKAVLDKISPGLRRQVSCTNSIAFIFSYVEFEEVSL
jgi:predicted TIM-barrel fold metal-dependent hydrolase